MDSQEGTDVNAILKWVREIQCWHAAMLSGPDGRPSLAKNILFIGAVISSALMVKLVWTAKMEVEYLVIYLAFCSGHNLLSKFLDGKYELKSGVSKD